MCGVRPPRWVIQRFTCEGYIEYSIWVASGLVTARPLVPKSQAAWKPRLACEVTQIRSCGMAPRTMVQAEAQRPSMMTVSPDCAQALVLVDVGADPAAAVIRDPNHRVTSPHARDQENRRKQPRHETSLAPAPVECRIRI